ncbi:MAG: hypothetical protein ACI841_000029 [Planctomycetota bacterium]
MLEHGLWAKRTATDRGIDQHRASLLQGLCLRPPTSHSLECPTYHPSHPMKVFHLILPLLLARTAFAQCATEEFFPPTAHNYDESGYSIAIDGDYLLAGAPGAGTFNTGHVDMFLHFGGSYQHQGRLHAPGGAQWDQFGTSMAAQNSRAAFGSPYRNTPTTQGQVHVYDRIAGTWTHAAIVDPPATTPFAQAFGSSIALDGNRLALGAPDTDGGGAVFVYEFSAGSWVLDARVTSASSGAVAKFGTSVALEGDQLVVGAPDQDIGSLARAGVAYLFEKSPAGWVERQQFRSAPPNHNLAHFGTAVDVEGSNLAIGQPYETDNPSPNEQGRVHLYRRSGTSWTHFDEVSGSANIGRDRFGASLDLYGESLAVGAPSSFGSAQVRVAAYLFDRMPNGWVETRRIADDEIGYGHDIVLTQTQVVSADPFASVDGNYRVGGIWSIDRSSQGGVRPYCETTPNSVGGGARMNFVGRLSIAVDLAYLRCDELPAQAPTWFFYGSRSAQTPFDSSWLCVESPHFRFPMKLSNDEGWVRRRFNFSGPLSGSGAGQILPMSTWFCQALYLDQGVMRSSDALSITFCM